MRVFAAVLGLARTANWFLVFNSVQNLAWAPRATPGAAVVGHPCVSILVPARDEAGHIAACVQSLLRQRQLPAEILVLDDRSTDDTAAIVERIATEAGAARWRLQRVAK